MGNDKAKTIKRATAMAMSLAVMLTATACSKDLPEPTQQDATTETTQAAPAAASSDPTMTVVTTIDKSLPPDVASLTISIPTTPAEPKEGQAPGSTPNDIKNMLLDRNAEDSQISMSEEGANTIIKVSGLSIRDASASQRDAESMGAKVTDISYDVTDPSSIKKEAISEAYDKSREDANTAISAVSGSDNVSAGVSPTSMVIQPIETVAQAEDAVTVRVTIESTWPIVTQ